MKKSTVWKILFKDRDIKEADMEELQVLIELENCVKHDSKSIDLSKKIAIVEASDMSK